MQEVNEPRLTRWDRFKIWSEQCYGALTVASILMVAPLLAVVSLQTKWATEMSTLIHSDSFDYSNPSSRAMAESILYRVEAAQVVITWITLIIVCLGSVGLVAIFASGSNSRIRAWQQWQKLRHKGP